MKIYFASNTDLNIEPIDAWVPNAEQGHRILRALAHYYQDHVVIMRARRKHFCNDEDRYIGIAFAPEADDFLDRIRKMT